MKVTHKQIIYISETETEFPIRLLPTRRILKNVREFHFNGIFAELCLFLFLGSCAIILLVNWHTGNYAFGLVHDPCVALDGNPVGNYSFLFLELLGVGPIVDTPNSLQYAKGPLGLHR